MAMRRAFIPSFWRAQGGSAAVEMALIAPIFLFLMFGSFDLGNYFMSEHKLVKSVRDAARYASRLDYTHYPCSSAGADLKPQGMAPDSAIPVEDAVVNVAKTGNIAGKTNNNQVTLDINDGNLTYSYDCKEKSEVSDGDTVGIFSGMDYIPVVNVSATVDYKPLFNAFGLKLGLHLNASSQAAVMGV
jgi:Flp pilus assembly protein TadG